MLTHRARKTSKSQSMGLEVGQTSVDSQKS
jgi:hypothetical protein